MRRRPATVQRARLHGKHRASRKRESREQARNGPPLPAQRSPMPAHVQTCRTWTLVNLHGAEDQSGVVGAL